MSKNIKISNKNKGFTLIEVMVVVVILGILAALIVPKIMSRPEQARMVKVKQDLLAIQSALDLYNLDNGFYPATDQGLAALVHKPDTDPVPDNWKSDGYLAKIPKDPWGHPYQYVNTDEHIHLYSVGPHSAQGGKEISMDNDDNAPT